MKDSEFIELLNLYLDHEISAADAARLEAEVQSNPERRKVYQQYCRMQKACKVLAADFVTAPETAESAAERKVVAFNAAAVEAASARRKRVGNYYTLGTVAAAAACVAIIFVGRSRQARSDALEFARQTPAITERAAPVVVSAPVAAAARPVMVSTAGISGPRALGSQGNATTTLVADPLLLASKAQADAMMVAAMEQAKSQFAWIEAMQLPPLQQPVPVHELRFESTASSLRPEGRALGSRGAGNANVEMAAFQFVK
jgi:hypothetical protein